MSIYMSHLIRYDLYIKGFKDQRVLGSAKHFGLNDQEYNRMTINAVADERTMHEIHFPAFERAVQEGVASVMASYNQLNGKYASENDYLLNQVLKKEFGFKGFVVSDWGATHSTVPAALAGLDLEMPVSEFFGRELLAAVNGKQVPETLIDDKVSRILRSMFDAGLFEPSAAPPLRVVNSLPHRQLALKLAEESHVLLKNEGKLLPIDFTKIHRIAVLGPNAAIARVGGGGSSEVLPFYSVSILEGLRERIGKRAQILTAETLPEQIAVAARADLVVLALGFSNEWEGEGVDRSTFALPPAQVSLLKSVLNVNPHTVVVLTSGNPVDMNDWVDRVPAIFFTSYAGQEGGSALADLLLGTVNPSGHLPFTMLNRWEDLPGFAGYPETNGAVLYTEGLYVGYRHYDKAGLNPIFPFGHGLSYTDFIYSRIQVTIRDRHVENPQVDVQFTVRNRGARSGSEVAQLYVQDENPQIDRPVQELKGFERIRLSPGESQKVTLHLNLRSFAYYDVTDHRWRVNPGKYGLRIGSSSRDIRLRAGVNLH